MSRVKFHSNVSYSYYDDTLFLFGLTSKGYRYVESPMNPYIFTSKKALLGDTRIVGVESTDLRWWDCDRVYMMELVRPNDVPDLRRELSSDGIKTYEADIPFDRRVAIDVEGIFSFSQRNIGFVDIEVDDEFGFPFDYGQYKIYSIGVENIKGKEWWLYLEDYDSEADMLKDFVDLVDKEKFSVLAGWNFGFDWGHLTARMKELGVNGRVSRIMKLIQPVDLLEGFQGSVKGLPSYNLDYVGNYLGFGGKVERHEKISKMVKEGRREDLREYNMRDVEITRLIEDEFGFANIPVFLADYVHLALKHISPVRLWDSLIIRRLRELGFVAPNYEGVRNSHLKLTGGYVKKPLEGFWGYTDYTDVTSEYPSIIINDKVDIDGFHGEVLPYLEEKYFKLRQEFKKKYKETGDKTYNILQNALKSGVINALYGIQKKEGFRFADVKRANYITTRGRELVKSIIRMAEEEVGVKAIYADTDGIQFYIGDFVSNDEEARAFSQQFIDWLNERIAPFQIKEELIWKRIFMSSKKKRYVGLTLDGKIKAVGFDVRRGDKSPLQKRIMAEMFEKIFKENATYEDLRVWLDDIRRRLYKGEFNDELVLSVGMGKENYKGKTKPPHVRAYLKAKRLGHGFYGKVRYVWLRGGKVEPVWDGRDISGLPIDYSRYWGFIDKMCKPFLKYLKGDVLRQSSLMSYMKK